MELNQAQMLAEAVPAALGGQRVIVLTFDDNHSWFLIRSAESSLSGEHIQRIGSHLIRFPSGGFLKCMNFLETQENSGGMMVLSMFYPRLSIDKIGGNSAQPTCESSQDSKAREGKASD